MRARGLAFLLALVLAARTAAAADPPTRITGFGRKAGKLVVYFGIEDLFQPVDRQRLTSGFATRALVRMLLFRDREREPIAQAFRWTEIVYDIWDERFHVRRADANGATDPEVATSAEEAIRSAASFVAFPVADLARLPPGSYWLSVRADLNPLSPEVVAEVRRWLARPPGQGRLTPGDSFFGSVVSIFVNPRIEDSDRRVQFVSQPYVLEPGR